MLTEIKDVNKAPLRFSFPEGNITIHYTDIDLFEKLKKLPSHIKLSIFEISEQDYLKYVAQQKAKLTYELKICFKHNFWRCRDDGEMVDFKNDDFFMDVFNVKINKDQFMKLLKKNAFTIDELKSILSVFQSQTLIYSNIFEAAKL
jgi:hypothetical protein